MSLTNNLSQATQYVSATGPRRYYNVLLADLVAGAGFQTVDIVLDTFKAGNMVVANAIKHTVAVAGTGLTTVTARLKLVTTAATTQLGSGALTVSAAPGLVDGTNSIIGVTPVAGDIDDDLTKLVMTVTVTAGAGNLSATTAGEIHASALVFPMPLI